MPQDPKEIVAAEESDRKTQGSNPERIVRLSVNLNAETAEIFRTLTERKGLSITEGIRRAISIWSFVEDAGARGAGIQLIEPDGRVRDVILLPS